jgi:2-phosphosulfolactate phosphatase
VTSRERAAGAGSEGDVGGVEVVVESLLAGARRARGTVVVIDVFRAFTTAAVVLARGAEKIVMVDDVAAALALREAGVGELCMGEVGGVRAEGFDLGNSPFEALSADVAGRTVIQRTSAGTQGVAAAAEHAERLFAGSLVTASATARAVLAGSPDVVTLVAMGAAGEARTDEDELCALHLRHLLTGHAGDPAAVRALVLAGGRTLDAADPEMSYLHPGDVGVCLDVDRFDLAVEVRREDGLLVARAA